MSQVRNQVPKTFATSSCNNKMTGFKRVFFCKNQPPLVGFLNGIDSVIGQNLNAEFVHQALKTIHNALGAVGFRKNTVVLFNF